MNHDEALEKAKKLLRLSQSNNPHEAALAASRAQEIIDRFKIESISLEMEDKKAAPTPDEPIRDFRADPLDDSGRAETWKYRLASEIAKQNQCKLYSCRGICIIGRPSDATAVRYLFAWLSREIERLARQHCAGYGRNYFNNFRIGAAETVAKRLAEQRVATRNEIKQEAVTVSLHALAVVESALVTIEKRAADVEAWTKANVKLRAGSSSSYRGNYEARNAGREAGYSVRMQPSAGSLGSSQRSLGGF